MIRLLFPYVCIEDNLLETGQLDQEYIDLLKNEIDSMRKKDPVGRKISNQYTGWQSNDGCESSPIFTKLIRMINHKFNTELLNWTGHKSNQIQLNIETGRPGALVGENGLGIENLLKNIKKFLPNNRQITINIIEVEKIKQELNKKDQDKKKDAKSILEKIQNKTYEIKKLSTENKELYGSVKPTEISKLINEREKVEINTYNI